MIRGPARLIDDEDGQSVEGEFDVGQAVELMAPGLANDPEAMETMANTLIANPLFSRHRDDGAQG